MARSITWPESGGAEKLNRKCPKNKQEVEIVAGGAWQSISRDGTQHLLVLRKELQASFRRWKLFILSRYFWSLNKWGEHIETDVAATPGLDVNTLNLKQEVCS